MRAYVAVLLQVAFVSCRSANLPLKDMTEAAPHLQDALDASALLQQLPQPLTQKPLLRFANHILTDKTLKAGQPADFYCDATSIPGADITWYLNGRKEQEDKYISTPEKLLNQGKKMIANSLTISHLRFPCVDARHNGVLRCVVRSGNLTIQQEATVKVVGYSKPCMRKSRLLAASPPSIRYWVDARFENIGNAVVLPCRATRGASFAWFNEDRTPLNDHPDYKVLYSGDLLIYSLSWEHMGTYKCIASNEWGQDRQEVFIYPTTSELTEEERVLLEEDKTGKLEEEQK